MNTLLRDPLHRGWLILAAATVLGYALRAEASVGPSVGLATLAIGYLKGRLVILDFMELRAAPLLWRALVEGWLALLTLLVAAVYLGVP